VFSGVVCLFISFAMITYSVGVDEVAGLETPLQDEELSVRMSQSV